MDYPKLRLIEMIPIRHESQELILIRDPEGIMEESLIVSRDVAYLFSLMNGQRSLRDIQAEYMRVFGELIYMDKLSELVSSLDEHLLLENERYSTRLNLLKTEYESADVRRPYLAGKSYPENRMELIVFLDEIFSQKVPDEEVPTHIKGILAPHIDYSRGREVYAKTYLHLKDVEPSLVVIFGTCHRASEKLWNISLKDFLTPLERIVISPDLKEIVKNNSVLKKYISEWPHRAEHSIELQLPLLQFMIQREFEILPILTGSMHEYIEGKKNLDDQEIEDLVSSLKECLSKYGKPYIVISAADLAHIGAQFGDYYPLDALTLSSSKVKDEMLLEAIKECEADRFFQLIREEGDKRRICGLASIYFQLRLLQGCQCKIIEYKQWTDGASSVSFAGAIFYSEKSREDRI
ncbi:MAG: AmmeMemoRadiSam system protein B [Deltaproteobacteria bacterium]|nr:AmmeMemoRadiSam system protein B [Deltaproteobacteria bacterium]